MRIVKQRSELGRKRRPAFSLFAWMTIAPLQAAEQTLEVESLRVEDGDTLIAELAGEEQRLQLADIDAPEDSDNAKLRHDLGRTGLDADTLRRLGAEATAHLRGLTEEGGPFRIRFDADVRDRYGRIMAVVSNRAGRSLGSAMLEDGFARVLEPRTSAEPGPPPSLTELETRARAAGSGLWGTYPEQAEAWRRGAAR